MPITPVRSWSHTVDSGLRLAFAVPVTASLAGDLPHVLRVLPRLEGLGVAGLMMVIASMLLMLVSLLMRGEKAFWTMALVGLMAVGQVLTQVGVSPGRQLIAWWPLGSVIALVCYLAVWTRPRVRVQWTAPAVIVLAGIRAWQMLNTGSSLVMGLTEAVLIVQVTAAAAIISDQLRATAVSADAAVRARRGSRHQRAAAVAYQNQMREVERFLHDEVVHALRAVAMDRNRIPATEAQRICADAWAKLAPNAREHRNPTRDLMGGLDATVRDSGLIVQISGSAPALPPEIIEAICGAVGEALHNVQRHSGVYEAAIAVARDGRGVHVQVSDAGLGFDPDAVSHRGLVTSVLERLEEVGGRAELTAAPEMGTQIDLYWQPRATQQTPAARARSRLSLAAVPPLVGNLVVAAMLVPEIQNPLLGVLATLLVTFAGFPAVRRLFSGPLGRVPSFGLILTSALAIVLNALALDPGDTRGLHLWLVNGVTPLVFLVIISQPFAVGLASVAIVSGTGILSAMVRFGSAATWQHYSLVLLVPSGWLGVMAMQLMIELLGKRADDASEAAARSDSHAYHLAARAEISEQRLARIREELGPFLKAVAAGVVDPNDTEVRRDAAVLESLVRDDIRFGGGSPELRRQLTALRRRGWDVEVRLTSTSVRQLDPDLFTMVASLPDPDTEASLIVTNLNDRITAVVQADKEILEQAVALWRAGGGEATSSSGFARLSGAITQ